MRDKYRIDLETGMMIEPVTPNQKGEDIVETPCDKLLYHPKWDGSQWVEGLTESEILERKAEAEQDKQPSIEERLEQTEQLLQATTMAFTEFIFSQTMEKQHDNN